MKEGKNDGAVTKYLAVADVYTVQGKTERALTMLKKVIELQPMNIEIRQRHIDLLEEYGQKEEAIQEYINLAEVFFPLAELDSARAAYTKALELSKSLMDSPGVRMKLLQRLADLDIQRLDWESAIATYNEISEVSPSNRKASIAIVDLNTRLNKSQAAEKEIERFLMLFDPKENQEVLEEYLTSLNTEVPNEPFIIRQLVDFYKAIDQPEKAISELDSLGDMLLDAGRKDDAIAVIQEIVSLGPPNEEEYQKLLEQLGNL
jgi:tetratricopeptide (TPR) repeat protein